MCLSMFGHSVFLPDQYFPIFWTPCIFKKREKKNFFFLNFFSIFKLLKTVIQIQILTNNNNICLFYKFLHFWDTLCMFLKNDGFCPFLGGRSRFKAIDYFFIFVELFKIHHLLFMQKAQKPNRFAVIHCQRRNFLRFLQFPRI